MSTAPFQTPVSGSLSGKTLFQRVCRVVAGDLLVEGLRTKFKVKKTLTREPNELQLEVYNLSQDSRARVQVKGLKVILEAGYVGTTAQIFSGDARIVDSQHVGPDWITKVQCGDGERAYRYSTVSSSFAPGARVSDVFQQVAQATGLDVSDAVNTVQANVSDQYTQGYSAFGKTVQQVEGILRGRGFEWSIQDGKLQVLQNGAVLPRPGVLLSPETGLIGSPEHGEPHASLDPTGALGAQREILGGIKVVRPPVLKVKALLMAALVPGCRVRVQSEAVKGDFRVQLVEHTGDTFGNEWYTEIEAVPL